jgi:hypothetical protein
MTDSSELQGEITALCCFVGALASTLPLSSQMRLWPAFEQKASQLREQLSQEALRGFELATISLSSKRVYAAVLWDGNGRCSSAVRIPSSLQKTTTSRPTLMALLKAP